MQRNVWIETKRGGLIMYVNHRHYLARPFDRVGMNTVLSFDTEFAARDYADNPAMWDGWGMRPIDRNGNLLVSN
jgi:hypothetical protein